VVIIESAVITRNVSEASQLIASMSLCHPEHGFKHRHILMDVSYYPDFHLFLTMKVPHQALLLMTNLRTFAGIVYSATGSGNKIENISIIVKFF
jgi:hypothetical protein